MTFKLILFSFIGLLVQGNWITVAGQRFQNISQAEDTLRVILASVNNARDDSSKFQYNQLFSACMMEALQIPSTDEYPFESLKTVVKLTSPDKIFRIFQWNLPTRDGKNSYYGFIKMLGQNQPVIYPLIDHSGSLPEADTLTLDNMHWLGALYYKIIPEEIQPGRTVYTLLGWAGRNARITQKVIEILSFDDQNKPLFGLKLFPNYHGGALTRIIFRFAASTTMSLKYEKQEIAVEKKWNSKKRVFEHTMEETQLIVCDRMVPQDSQLEGQYEFYIAAGDIFDGFVFTHGSWTFIEGLDAKNKK
jgi:hypothetical protein